MSNEPNKKDKEKSILETIKEVNQKERLEKMHRMSEEQKQFHEKEEKEREEYGNKLLQEKVELMKIKQGVKEDTEEVVTQEKKKYTLKQKIENFIYHHKITMVLGGFFVALTAFLIYDYLRKEDPDMTVMVLVDDYNFSLCLDELENIMEEYIEDINGDGEVMVSVYYMPISEDVDPYTLQASSTKLFALMQDGETMMVIADPVTKERLNPEITLEDLSSHFPDNEKVKEYGYYFFDEKFASEIGYEPGEKITSDYYIGIRKAKEGLKYSEKMKKNYDIAYSVLENIIKRYQ